ncbi:MAG: XRE family transcriptional regulator [Actinomycetota bacterium]|nr:XRE family transcriptional regulator [Actinomycetota bacterium]
MNVRSREGTDRKTRAHDDSIRAETDKITAFLQEIFGAKLVAHMAGVSDDKRVNKWIKGEGMSAQAEARLRAAHQIAWFLLAHDSPETVRAWFIGMNPQLDYEAPADAIRDDRHRHAMVAAEAFVEGA